MSYECQNRNLLRLILSMPVGSQFYKLWLDHFSIVDENYFYKKLPDNESLSMKWSPLWLTCVYHCEVKINKGINSSFKIDQCFDVS